jgi:catechol 2,3-dioxygenase-like lactoylglutathione lyase family enzyme
VHAVAIEIARVTEAHPRESNPSESIHADETPNDSTRHAFRACGPDVSGLGIARQLLLRGALVRTRPFAECSQFREFRFREFRFAKPLGTMPILGLDHVQLAIPVGGEKRARDFYVGILKFTEVEKPAVMAGRNSMWFVAGPVNLHLGVEPEFHPAKRAHPALVVDNLDEIVSGCESAGFLTKPDVPVNNFRRVHIFDPFGNRLELLESTTL